MRVDPWPSALAAANPTPQIPAMYTTTQTMHISPRQNHRAAARYIIGTGAASFSVHAGQSENTPPPSRVHAGGSTCRRAHRAS